MISSRMQISAKAFARVVAYDRPTTIDGATEALASMRNHPVADGPPKELLPLRSLAAPVLIVWCRHDRVIPVAVADAFAQAIPGARKVIFDDSGHLPHEEVPQRFNPLVADFSASLS